MSIPGRFSYCGIALIYIYIYIGAALTTHELEWLEPWPKLAELELKCSNRELVHVGNTHVTQNKLNKHGNVNKSPPINIYFLIAGVENDYSFGKSERP